MHDLEFLVPSALVDPALAADLLRDRPLPRLSRVLARAAKPEDIALAEHAPLTPWQTWAFGRDVGRGASLGAEINLAELWAMACGIAPAPNGRRWVAEPAHFVIARDHLRLDDPRALGVTIAEARALADAIEPVLSESGWHLEPIEPATLTHWLLHRDDDLDLSGAAIERAIGDNVAAWQPRSRGTLNGRSDDAALDWRRCSNEIQMLWFGHPVNQAREERGQPAINTLWLSGNGVPSSSLPHYRAVDSSLPLLAALPVEPDATRALESFDGFINAARAEDWSGWRVQLDTLDARIGALVDDQRRNAIGELTVVLCGRDHIRSIRLAPRALGKFWRGWGAGPSLAELFAEHPAP